MQRQSIIIFEPDTVEQEKALKAFGKALKLKYEVKTKPYNPEFVEMIEKGDRDLANGKGVKLSIEEFKALCK
ncbi:MAG TPA: hypothetical protein GXZ56_05150 [Bacteroidales bacterium]|jgi:hypothetical protein|nr:hypothetical protein [Bacteroidales bacterium]